MSKESTIQILNRYGDAMVLLIRNLISPHSATGKTVKSIRYTVTSKEDKESLKLYGRRFIKTLETGRGPRKSSVQSDFRDNILEWMKIRGITKGNQKKDEQLARFLTYKINKEGDKTFREGGEDIFSGQLTVLVKSLENKLRDDFSKSYLTEVINIFK